MFRLLVALSVLALVWGMEDRIVNGRTSSISEYPYQVSLQQHGSHFCGGSVLSPNWILTAAHCVTDIIQKNLVPFLTVRLGSSKWNQGGVLKNAEFVSMHPEYNSKSMNFDVGLIKLSSSVVFSAAIKPVTLPKTLPPMNSRVVVSGWGKLSENNDELPTNLQSVELSFLPNDKCKSYEYGYRNMILDTMICADGPSKDSCQGDSGGPLAMADKNVQLGVVSWGAGCAQKGFPGIYCDLTHPDVRSYLRRTTGLAF
ncbi:trypsin delta-like [Eupeodes corollae]|uniref:trypsin delta-like n=1 Tax=Eupeodes corollae TaxID=290404 RepID=UPI0024913A2A|nr:trypsin delta-like [Eupeodes corollae]